MAEEKRLPITPVAVRKSADSLSFLRTPSLTGDIPKSVNHRLPVGLEISVLRISRPAKHSANSYAPFWGGDVLNPPPDWLGKNR